MNVDLIKKEWTTAPVTSLFEPEAISDVLHWVTQQATLKVKGYTVETSAGRKEIASTAAKVARCKVFLDDRGKDLVREWKIRSKEVDIQRKRIRDDLDALKEQVRKPVTDWENAEKERIESLQERLNDIMLASLVDPGTNSEGIAAILARISGIEVDDSFQELEERAEQAKKQAVADLRMKLAHQIKVENDQEELEKLRKQAEQRAIKDREESIRQEAAHRAKIEAEQAAAMKAEQDRLAIERALAEKAAAEARTKRAEEQHAAELVAIKVSQEQAEQLQNSKLPRIKELQMANREHRDHARGEIIEDLEKICSLTFAQALNVYISVANNKIRHLELDT